MIAGYHVAMSGTKLSQAIEHGLATKDLRKALAAFERIVTVEDAHALLAALPRFPAFDDSCIGTPLGVVASLYQSTEDSAVLDVLGEGFPIVHDLYDRALAEVRARVDDAKARCASDLVFMLKIYALYASQGGMERVIAAARDRQLETEYLWAVVFDIYASEGHPLGSEVVDALRSSLPRGFAGIAFLDACNRMVRENRLDEHPFASIEGLAHLEGCLRDPDEAHFSYAQSATAALPFLAEDARERLLAVAMAHPDRGVRLEAAWADARSGGNRGLDFLAEACLAPHSSAVACGYLSELGREDVIPDAARDPDFEAQATISRWLQHPSELGEVPDQLELYDTRVLDWPPTNDRRRVWLFSWAKGDDRGLAMVGSITFALFGEATADLSPEDAYALHCCWELSMNGDARAPKERSIAAGRKLLGLDPS